MRRAFKIAAAVLATLIAGAVALVFVLTNTDWGHQQIRSRVVSALNGSAHGIVKVGRIDGNLLKGLTLHDISITDSAGAPFVVARSISAGYGLRALISKRIDLGNVVLDHPTIVLDRQPGGLWNYERIFPTDSTAAEKDTAGLQYGDWLVFNDARVVQGTLTVRTPWAPDTSLTAAQRDSAIAFAFSDDTRTTVERVAGGFQQVQQFQRIDGVLPLVRIAHPDHPTRRIEVDSLRMVALPFAPPAADVRQLSGTFELNGDSVWFRGIDVMLPASRAALEGRYTIANGDLSIRTSTKGIATGDVRFLYPPLPDSGTAAFDLALDMTAAGQRFTFKGLDFNAGNAHAAGALGMTLGDTLYLHETDLTFENVGTRLIERMIPGLVAPRQGTLTGRAKVDGTLAMMRVDGDVTFNEERSGRSRVIAAGEIGAVDGVVSARNLRVTLSPLQVVIAKPDLPSSFPIGGVLTGNMTLDGATDGRLNARGLDLTLVDRGQRSRVVGSGALRLGDVMFVNLDVQARPLSLVTVGQFAPAAELRGSVSGPIRVDGTLRDLAINSTLRSADGGTISATGRLDLVAKEIGYNLQAATVLFNANAVTGKAPRTSLSADFSAIGRGFDPETMRGDFTTHITTSTLDTVALDSARIRLRIAEGMANIDTMALRAPGAAVDVLGTFGMSKTGRGNLTYKASVDSLGKFARYLPVSDTGAVFPRPAGTAERLARARQDSARIQQRLAVARAAGEVPPAMPVAVDTPSAIPRDSLAGSVTAEGTLVGGLGGFDARGRATAAGLVVQGNTVRKARADFSWLGALTPEAAMSVNANADSVSAAGFALDSVAARLTYRKPGGSAQVAVFQNTARDYSLFANYAIYTDRKELLLDTMRLRFDTTRWVSARQGVVRWGQPGIEIDSIDLGNGRGGRVFADGRLPTSGPANLSLIVKDFEVGDLMGLLQSDLDARGLLSVNGTLTGTTAAPTIKGDAAVANAMYRGTTVPDVRTTFDYADVKLAARADATYVGRNIAHVNGTVPINLAISGVTASRLPDAPASVDMRLDSLPLELAGRFTDAISQIQGYARGQAALRGTLRKPDITGDVSLALGQARVNALGITVQQVTGAIRLQGDTIVIDSLTARSRGRLAIRGGIGIAEIAKPSFNLRFDAMNARVLDNEQGRVNADAVIAMTGPFDAIAVNGRARVRDGVFYIPKTDEKQVINAGDPAVFAVIDTTNVLERELVPAQSPFLANLRMNLRLAVDRDTWVRNQEANVEVYTEGDLRIDIDRRRQILTLDGVMNTDRGEYEFLSKRFQIKRGTATFVGTQEINPLLQLTGEYEVKQAAQQALAIRVLIGGTLLAPRLTLESDAQPPISQSDLLSYLAFGSESGSLLQFGGSSVAGGTPGGGLVGTSAALASRQLVGVALGVITNQLEGEAARSLGADVFNITPANVPVELAGGQFGSFLRGTQVEFGKYFNTQTFIGLQAQPSAVPGFRIEHRFRTRPGLSLESTFQPRFFLPQPSLSEQEIIRSNSLGLFLVRRWRF